MPVAADAQPGAGGLSEWLDIDQVNEMRALDPDGGVSVLAEFVGMLETQGPERIATIQGALELGDLSGAAGAAHSFKGASANLGAIKLAAVCKRVEIAGKAGDDAEATAAAATLQDAFDQSLAALKQVVAAG
jgi:two-component system, sensor histidine kinase and response regulator